MGIEEWPVFDSRCKRAQVLAAVVLRKDKRTTSVWAKVAKGVWCLSGPGAR